MSSYRHDQKETNGVWSMLIGGENTCSRNNCKCGGKDDCMYYNSPEQKYSHKDFAAVNDMEGFSVIGDYSSVGGSDGLMSTANVQSDSHSCDCANCEKDGHCDECEGCMAFGTCYGKNLAEMTEKIDKDNIGLPESHEEFEESPADSAVKFVKDVWEYEVVTVRGQKITLPMLVGIVLVVAFVFSMMNNSGGRRLPRVNLSRLSFRPRLPRPQGILTANNLAMGLILVFCVIFLIRYVYPM